MTQLHFNDGRSQGTSASQRIAAQIVGREREHDNIGTTRRSSSVTDRLRRLVMPRSPTPLP